MKNNFLFFFFAQFFHSHRAISTECVCYHGRMNYFVARTHRMYGSTRFSIRLLLLLLPASFPLLSLRSVFSSSCCLSSGCDFFLISIFLFLYLSHRLVTQQFRATKKFKANFSAERSEYVIRRESAKQLNGFHTFSSLRTRTRTIAEHNWMKLMDFDPFQSHTSRFVARSTDPRL